MSQQIENSLKVSVPDLSDVDPFTTYSDTLHKMLTGKFKKFKELFKKEYSHSEAYIVCDDEKLFHCRFPSRNEPPTEVYNSLLQKFPELEFSYHWYDWDGNPSGPAFGYYNYIDPKIFKS
jgi:hypothetical protein